MKNLIDSLCSAIAQQEGWNVANSLPRRNNNPGDLRAAPWRPSAKIVDGYWKADSAAEGIAGLYHQVALDIARGMTLAALLAKWAPSSDHNDTNAYLSFVMKRTGIVDANMPLWELLEL